MPFIEHKPCAKVLVEFDTDIAGTCDLLYAMAKIDLRDAKANPRLRTELARRCLLAMRREPLPESRGAAPIRYESEPIDTWQALSVIAEKFPRQTWIVDCDCVTPLWAAYWTLRFASVKDGSRPQAGVAISQPKKGPCRRDASKLCGRGTAHAFTVLRGLSSGARAALRNVPGVVDVVPGNDAGWEDVTVFDGSVLSGMDEPPASFYGKGESALLWLPREDERTAAA